MQFFENLCDQRTYKLVHAILHKSATDTGTSSQVVYGLISNF